MIKLISAKANGELSKNYESWIAWSIMSFYCVLQFLFQGSVGVLAEGVKESFGIDATGIGLLSSSFYIPYIAMQIPAGMIYDRFGIRRVAIFANSVLFLGCICLASAPNIATAILSRTIIGFGASFGFVGLIFGVKKWFPIRQFAAIVAIAECLCMLGVSIANNILSLSAAKFGWRTAVGFCAILTLSQLFVMILYLHDTYLTPQGNEKLENKILADLKSVLKHREVWLAGLYGAGVFSIVSVFVSLWSIPFLTSIYKLDVIEATSISSNVYIGIAVSSLMIGWLSKKFCITSVMKFGSGLTLIFSLFFLYVRLPTSLLYLLAFSMGFFSAVYQLSFTQIAKSIPNEIGGAAIGATNMIMMLAAPILQTLIGIIISSNQGLGVLDGFEVYSESSYHLGLSILPLFLFIAFLTTFYMQYSDSKSIKKWIVNHLIQVRQTSSLKGRYR